MDQPIIETNHLNFSFKPGENILADVNLSAPKGSIYGFLGPNGAGKTTTLRLILGLLREENAHIKLFGNELRDDRIGMLKKIGSLIEQPSLYMHLTGRENLEVFRLSYGCPKERINEVLAIVGLSDAAGKKAKAYSLGMKQRLAIAIALLHNPELLILDEPTNGLDPTGIIEIRDLIRKLNQQEGKTILISSHLLAEVEKIATHVGIIDHGKLLFQGTLNALQVLKTIHTCAEVKVDDTARALDLLKHENAATLEADDTIRFGYISEMQVATINEMLVRAGIRVYRIGVMKNDLEDLFLQILSEKQL
ncbi:ABC transporter ATP-binding protein [Dyadobacter pollutisoli]|uniref:ABC transporter ATP-binding protein n=1 Tax=Dyadobacter pollutisoli TaxID=2910158 RepID=A0A9E8NIG3_9BACT|nr:ABC transporter ATP-binding protein [Dyadobacter pollutisoli]WAC14877.1 ABC transporter ATP-binding protein [Dyadobacter pollutisoli]